MVQVPTYDTPDVQPQDATPAVANYGPGIGGALATAGGEAFHTALAVRDQQDAVAAQQKQIETFYKTQPDLRDIQASQGNDSFTIAERGQKLLQDAGTSAAAELDNPRQQRIFNSLWNRVAIGQTESLNRTQFERTQQVAHETGQAMVNMQVDRAAQDPTQIDDAMSQAEQATRARFNGYPDAFVTDQVGQARSRVTERAIQSQLTSLAPNGLADAAALFQHRGNELDAAARLRVQTELRPKVVAAQAAAAVPPLGVPEVAGAIPAEQRPAMLAQAVSGTNVPTSVLDAVVTHESQWNPAAVGGAGEVGLGQVKPSTAADPGFGLAPVDPATLTDPAANLRTAAKYLDARGKASGVTDWSDPAQMQRGLAAYNSGSNAAQYAADVSRTAMAKASTGAAVAPDLDARLAAARANAERVAPGDDAVASRAEQLTIKSQREWEANTAMQRAALTRGLPDVQASLEAGNDVAVPTAAIHALLPAEKATDILSDMDLSRQAGQVLAPLQSATPAERAEAIADLRSGQGVYSDMIRRAGHGTLAGAGMDGPADAGGAQPGNATDFRLRQKLAARVEEVDERNNKALTTDPAAYVGTLPEVRPLLQQASQSGDPSAMQTAIGASLAMQSHMGVASPQVLTNGQAAGLARTIATSDPETGDIGRVLDPSQPGSVAAGFGSYWNQAFGQVVRQGKLPPEYQLLAAIDNPIGRDDAQRAFGQLAKKGGLQEMSRGLPPDAADAILSKRNGGLEAAISLFTPTTTDQDLIDTVRGGVKTLALYYAGRGTPGDAALSKAAGVVLGRYDFDGTMRAPKGTLQDTRDAGDFITSQLRPEELQPWHSSAPGLTDDDDRAKALEAARRGFWVPNADDTGWELRSKLLDPSGLDLEASAPVRYASGKPVAIQFSDVPRLLSVKRQASGGIEPADVLTGP